MNVIPLFTEEDKAFVAEKKEKGREESGIKSIARRFEAEKVKVRAICGGRIPFGGLPSRLPLAATKPSLVMIVGNEPSLNQTQNQEAIGRYIEGLKANPPTLLWKHGVPLDCHGIARISRAWESKEGECGDAR